VECSVLCVMAQVDICKWFNIRVGQCKVHLKQAITEYLEILYDNVGSNGLVWKSGLECSKTEGHKE